MNNVQVYKNKYLIEVKVKCKPEDKPYCKFGNVAELIAELDEDKIHISTFYVYTATSKDINIRMKYKGTGKKLMCRFAEEALVTYGPDMIVELDASGSNYKECDIKEFDKYTDNELDKLLEKFSSDVEHHLKHKKVITREAKIDFLCAEQLNKALVALYERYGFKVVIDKKTSVYYTPMTCTLADIKRACQ